MKQCIYIDVNPHMCGDLRVWKILTVIDGLCSVGFMKPTGVLAGVLIKVQHNVWGYNWVILFLGELNPCKI
jgi:hypothetical protein